MAFSSVLALGIEVTGARALFMVDALFTAARASMAGGTLTTVVAGSASSMTTVTSEARSMPETVFEWVPAEAGSMEAAGMEADTGNR